jgi:hypothetical protein
MSAERNFEFFVGGIEDGILEVLKAGMAYVKEFATYGGELDSAKLREALGALTPRFPLVLASYSDGNDVLDPQTSALPGAPMRFRHDCGFSVIVCAADARGERQRRRGAGIGAYKMLSDVRELLSGWQFKVPVGNERVLLNPQPFIPAGVEYIARLPDLTAYTQHFDTYFRYTTPDRRAASKPVAGLNFGVSPAGEAGGPGGSPGVNVT